ncbi:MAG: TrkH family potassium uptake protein [Eubacterium ventriosum]
MIIVGTLMLMLPVSSAKGQWTDFVTALFTATTSTCVTGLVVVPTYAYWSLFGKVVILILIQLGGLGIISIATGVLIIIGKKINLKERRLIQESYNLDTSQSVVLHIIRIFSGTFAVEGIGAILYSFRFIPKYGVAKGVWYSVFHAISAFCNAGIDLLGDNSFMAYKGDVLINITTMFLIVVGGIGFIVWWDILKNINNIRNKKYPLQKFFERLSLHSKIVLTVTAIAIFGGAILTFAFEYNNPETLGTLKTGEKILASFFQSVTLRTAGFCTINQAGLRNASVLLAFFLMLMGGSPMGTAGGIKTTTVALLFLDVKSVVTGKNATEAFKRRINRDNIKNALAVMTMAISILMIAVMALTFTETGSLTNICYEAFSAIGTVGLSMNFTASLSLAGKLIIIALMFLEE